MLHVLSESYEHHIVVERNHTREREKEIEKQREREREKNRETERETERERKGEIERERRREIDFTITGNINSNSILNPIDYIRLDCLNKYFSIFSNNGKQENLPDLP